VDGRGDRDTGRGRGPASIGQYYPMDLNDNDNKVPERSGRRRKALERSVPCLRNPHKWRLDAMDSSTASTDSEGEGPPVMPSPRPSTVTSARSETASTGFPLLPTSTGRRAIHWAFTSFQESPESVIATCRGCADVTFVAASAEVCSTTARAHSQCYLQLRAPARLAKLKKVLPGAHWEPAMGTPAQNMSYISKESDPLTWGTLRTLKKGGAESQASNYADVIALAKEGQMDQLCEQYPREYLHRYSTIRTIWKDHQTRPPDSPWTRGVWICGPSGVGKSKMARQIYAHYYAKMANKWFDGYTNEPYIILDDVGPDQAKHLTYHLKIWGDRYAFVAESKNWSRYIAPRGFIVTSQYTIGELWSDDESRTALHRRYTVISLGREDAAPWLSPHFRWDGPSWLPDATIE